MDRSSPVVPPTPPSSYWLWVQSSGQEQKEFRKFVDAGKETNRFAAVVQAIPAIAQHTLGAIEHLAIEGIGNGACSLLQLHVWKATTQLCKGMTKTLGSVGRAFSITLTALIGLAAGERVYKFVDRWTVKSVEKLEVERIRLEGEVGKLETQVGEKEKEIKGVAEKTIEQFVKTYGMSDEVVKGTAQYKELEQQLEKKVNEYNAETQRLQEELTKNLQEAGEKAGKEKEEALEQLKISHKKEVDELTAKTVNKEEHEKQLKELQDEHKEKVKELEKETEQKLEKQKTTLTEEHQSEIEKLNKQHQEKVSELGKELNELKDKCENFEKNASAQLQEEPSKNEDKLQQLAIDHEKTLQELQELQEKYSKAINEKEPSESDIESRFKEKYEESIKKLQEELRKGHEESTKKLEQQITVLQGELKTEKEKAVKSSEALKTAQTQSELARQDLLKLSLFATTKNNVFDVNAQEFKTSEIQTAVTSMQTIKRAGDLQQLQAVKAAAKEKRGNTLNPTSTDTEGN